MSRRSVRGRGDSGAGLVEYALVAGLLLIAIVGGLQWVQSSGEKAVDRQADNIDYASSGAGVPGTTNGSTPGGESPGGSSPDGSTAGGDTTGGSNPDGSTPGGETPGGSSSGGWTPGGSSSGGSTPSTAAPTTTTTTTAPPATTTTTANPGSPMTSLTIASATPTISWWNGKDGAWSNGITFAYGWQNGANISLSITRYYGNNKSETSTSSVYVNSGSSSPYIPTNAMSNSAASNVVSVTVTVTAISTQDANWQNQVIPVSGPSITITEPAH